MVEHIAVNQIVEGITNRRNIKVFPQFSHLQDDIIDDLEDDTIGQHSYAHFNFSGQRFTVSKQLLRKYPGSRLACDDSLSRHWVSDMSAYYFDRDPVLFNSILNIYRHGVFIPPLGYGDRMISRELQYWNLPVELASRQADEESMCLEEEFLWLESRTPPPPDSATKWAKFRFEAWCFFTDPLGPYTRHHKLSVAYTVLSIGLIILFMLIFGLSTSMEYRTVIGSSSAPANGTEKLSLSDCELKIECFVRTEPVHWITTAMLALMVFFVFEVLVRLIFCPEVKVYLRSVLNWVDILATLCAVASLAVHVHEYSMREDELTKNWAFLTVALQAIQVLRIFKLLQYATLLDGFMVMLLTLKASIHELAILFSYLIMAMFLFSTLVTYAELGAHVDHGIPDSLIGYWWAVVTMTTVGYGDYYPETALGYFIGILCTISGLIMTALPVAVIGSKFNIYWEHNRRRKQAVANKTQ